MFSPETDGIDHINIYSKGKTELGRFLTNFAHTPITTEDGKFQSVEGYWYWLSCRDDELRKLYGWKAKEYGRKVGASDWLDDEVFKNKILAAIEYKIRHSDQFYSEFKDSTLPFDHYYDYGGKVIRPKDGRWILEFLEQLREQLTNTKQE